MALGDAVTGELNGIVVNAAAKCSANMENKRVFALFVAVLASVSTAKSDTGAKTAAASCIASTGNSGTGAGSAAAPAFAIMEKYVAVANYVAGLRFASMGGKEGNARIVEEAAFVLIRE